jgi:hypothetical protein
MSSRALLLCPSLVWIIERAWAGHIVQTAYLPWQAQVLYEKCLRVDHAALKTGSECSLTTSQVERDPGAFLACFRLA